MVETYQQELTRAGPEPFGTHPHFQGAPKRQDQKTNQDVGLDALGFLVTVYVPFTIYYYSDYAPPTTAGAIGGTIGIGFGAALGSFLGIRCQKN